MRHLTFPAFFIAFITAVFSPLAAEIKLETERNYPSDWSDLYEKQSVSYGSEEAEKKTEALLYSIENWEDHYALRVLFLLRYTDYPRYHSFMLFPLYYNFSSEIDIRSRHQVLLWYRQRESNSVYQFLLPVYFYSHSISSCSSAGCRNISREEIPEAAYRDKIIRLSPLYLYRRENIYGGSATSQPSISQFSLSIPIIPLFSWQRDVEPDRKRESWRLTPVFFFQREGKESDMKTDAFSLIPVFYGRNRYHGVLPLYFSHRNSEKNSGGTYALTHIHTWSGERNTLWIYPYFKTKNSEQNTRFTAFFPLYYNWHGKSARSFGFFPWFTYNKFNDSKKSKLLFPLYYSGRRKSEDIDGNISTSHRLITPLHSRKVTFDGRGKTTNNSALLFFHWKTKNPELNGISLFPLFSYAKNNHTLLFPLYYNRRNPDNVFRTTLSVTHIHHTSEKTSTLWIWPYLHHRKKDQSENPGYLFRVIAPVYFHWNGPRYKLTTINPLLLDFNDRKTERHLHVNALLMSVWRERGEAILTEKEKETQIQYSDYRASWVYNLVNVTKRYVEESKVIGTGSNDNLDEQKPEESEVKIIRYIADARKNRRNSYDYMRFDILFSLITYEEADWEKHFRILPLYWLTWNDRLQYEQRGFFPVYFHHKSPKQEYFVSPVYARQRTAERDIDSYGIWLHWREYDKEKQELSHSWLWPLFYESNSPEQKTVQVRPLYSYKRSNNANGVKKTILSPIYYQESTLSENNVYRKEYSWLHYNLKENTPVLEKSISVNPLYFNYSKYWTGKLILDDKSEDTSERIWRGHRFYHSQLGVFHKKTLYEETEISKSNETSSTIHYTKSETQYANYWLLYDRGTSLKHINNGDTHFKERTGYLARTVYFSNDDFEKKFLLGYGLLFWKINPPEQNNYSWGTGAFVFADNRKPDSHWQYLFPLYYFHFSKRTSGEVRGFYSLLYIRTSTENEFGEKIRELSWLHSQKKQWWKDGSNESPKVHHLSYKNYFFLYDSAKEREISSDGTESNRETRNGLLARSLYWSKSDHDNKFLFGYGSIFWKNNPVEKGSYSWGLGGFLFIDHHSVHDHSQLLFPVYFYERNVRKDYDDRFFFSPLLLTWYDEDQDKYLYHTLFLWYDKYRNERHRRALLLGILYNETNHIERDFTRKSSLFGFLWAQEIERENNWRKTSLLNGLYTAQNKNGNTRRSIIGIPIN